MSSIKNSLIWLLQKSLGFNNYLFFFSVFKTKTLKYDPDEKDFFYFLTLIPDNANILDIGANLGYLSINIAKNSKNRVIYAFEPIPENYKILNKVVEYFKFNNIKTYNYALGNCEKEIEMIMPIVDKVKKQGLSHIANDHDEVGTKFKVTMKVLDQLDLFVDLPIHAIKIDTENTEFLVLDGGKKLLERDKPIVYCELYEKENKEKTIQLLKSLGYKLKVHQDSMLVDYDPAKHPNVNFFFV